MHARGDYAFGTEQHLVPRVRVQCVGDCGDVVLYGDGDVHLAEEQLVVGADAPEQLVLIEHWPLSRRSLTS